MTIIKISKMNEHGIIAILLIMLFVMTGEAGAELSSNDSLLFHEGAIYPGPGLPPIKTPYFINWFKDGQPGIKLQPHVTVVSWTSCDFTSQNYWDLANHGVLPMADVYVYNGGQNTCGKLDNENDMYNSYIIPAQNNFYAITVDEFAGGEYTRSEVTNSLNAIRKVKKQYPNLFVHVWYFFNMTQPIADGADVVNIFSSESYVYQGNNYQSIINTNVETIKSFGLEGKAVMGTDAGCWEYENKKTFGTPAEIDKRLKYLRSISPQMASNGVSLFWINRPGNSCGVTESYRVQYDKVMDDNFFSVSPVVSIITPANNSGANGTIRIAVSAAPNSRTGSPVVSYRYFIDNTLVKISTSPEFLWNSEGYSQGIHVITVHAVSSDYLAGVNQVIVNLGQNVYVPENSSLTSSFSSWLLESWLKKI